MLLTKDELHSLVELIHQSPHSLLGMQPLGDGRAWSFARSCPMPPKSKSSRFTKRTNPGSRSSAFHESGLFEGVTKSASRVYAYDLVITNHQGQTRRTRDAYSFLPTLGESDLFCSARATNAAFTKNSARNCA
jgi:hypothetical protein